MISRSMATFQNQLPAGEIVNDLHSQLNPTIVSTRLTPQNTSEVVAAINFARTQRKQIAISGGRHAMGGQQFRSAGVLLDMTAANKVLRFDQEQGLIEVQAGMLWPDLIQYLQQQPKNQTTQWSIAQKQTGCDRLSIGGALGANIHGRGLSMKPFVGDVEDFTLVQANGQTIRCSRSENQELFKLVIGGYGQFGITTSATIRLTQKRILRRSVQMTEVGDVIEKLEHSIEAGATYGDFQFAIDNQSPDFLKKGILSTYTPVEGLDGKAAQIAVSGDSEIEGRKLLSNEEWKQLLYLAHTNKTLAFDTYSAHYLKTDGQLYSSDTFQLATYLDNYHAQIDERLPNKGCRGTEMISEVYVPRQSLKLFMQQAAKFLSDENANVIYGTVRLIEKDDETFLPWAKERWACIVFNLHVDHSPYSMERAAQAFRGLIQIALECQGSYYLTYHRFATREQLMACYPQMPQFLELKAKHDPQQLLYSDWYEHVQRIVRTNRTLIA